MAGRFPGAADIEAFWKNLCDGRESIRVFKPQELDLSIPPALRNDPAYVAARGVLDDVALFDAAFFGISPLEAQLIDPQHRHFLEVSWHALEHAGYVPEHAPGPIGIFGGMYNATYFQRHLLPQARCVGPHRRPAVDARQREGLRDQPRSPQARAVGACCQREYRLLDFAGRNCDGDGRACAHGDCDIALAGGVAITCPPDSGHLYQEGAMASVDGHTRPFDASAMGTVFSDGVAIVVLRRLTDAIAAGDTVYAVLLGAAVNNDGSDRASFTAPSPEGQAAVISAAHDRRRDRSRARFPMSRLMAPRRRWVIRSKSKASRARSAGIRMTRGFCAIGSLKSNVGHLVIAAGAASLIKTSLSLHREALPPSIGFEKPNPQIDFASTPFVRAIQADALAARLHLHGARRSARSVSAVPMRMSCSKRRLAGAAAAPSTRSSAAARAFGTHGRGAEASGRDARAISGGRGAGRRLRCRPCGRGAYAANRPPRFQPSSLRGGVIACSGG